MKDAKGFVGRHKRGAGKVRRGVGRGRIACDRRELDDGHACRQHAATKLLRFRQLIVPSVHRGDGLDDTCMSDRSRCVETILGR